MSYDLIQFIADCQTSLKRNPGPAGREKVRADLERLLSNKDFVEIRPGSPRRTITAIHGRYTAKLRSIRR